MVEYVAMDVVDAVASLVVTGVIAFARLPAPFLGLPRRLPFRVASLGAADRDTRVYEGLFVVPDELDDLRLGHAGLDQLVGEHPCDGG